MYSIKDNIDNTIIIKKSKFITKIYRINSIDEINELIYVLKNEYKDATHICYAYILDGYEKCSDDGEPSGTAGLPILNILRHNNLNYILAVVIRYFGGIKLGAGGLLRAYSNSVSDALKLTDIVELVSGINVTIEFSYDNCKIIDNLLCDKDIIDKKYNDNIVYNFNVIKEEYDNIKDILNDKCMSTIINKNILVAKKV